MGRTAQVGTNRCALVYNSLVNRHDEGANLGSWQQWVRQPQRVWLRRALFQVHLWTGIALGLYVVMLSITGSALVYRNELDRFFATPKPTFDPSAKRLSKDELKAIAEKLYPGYTITQVGDRITRRNPTIEIWAEKGSDKKERLFNPYTGADLGEAVTQGEYFVLWLARLHDELLFDRPGKYWNGALSAVFTITAFTGLIVWWPGSSRWKRSLGIKWSSGWRRFNWDLHSAIGFWLFLFMGLEAATAAISPALKARLQGKTCFNFAKSDTALFAELEAVTAQSIAALRKAGYCA